MGAAAGTYIFAAEFHDPHRPGQLLLGAVFYIGKLFGRGVPGFHRDVPADDLIGSAFDLHQIFPGDRAIQIDGHQMAAHVKAHIMIAKLLIDLSHDQMLAGVLLHVVKTPLPVDGAGHFRTYFQRGIAQVEDVLPLLLYIQHIGASQDTQIALLTAAGGVEGSGIQRHCPAALYLFAAGDHRGKIFQMRICII